MLKTISPKDRFLTIYEWNLRYSMKGQKSVMRRWVLKCLYVGGASNSEAERRKYEAFLANPSEVVAI